MRRKVWSLGVSFASGNAQLFGHNMDNSSSTSSSLSVDMINRSGMRSCRSKIRRNGNGKRSSDPRGGFFRGVSEDEPIAR